VLSFILLVAGRAAGAELAIGPVSATSQGYLYVDYQLQRPFEGKFLDAIRSGLPSNLVYTFEVWRQRPGWWDALLREQTVTLKLRLYRDLLNDQYVLVSREEVRRFASLDSLASAACQQRQFLQPLLPGRPYYVAVTAKLAPLSVEDLQELEQWLQGSIRSGEGSATAGGISGLSGTLVGLLLSETGFGDRTVNGRTATFHPEEVRPALPHGPEGIVAPGTLPSSPHATPDSGRGSRSRP
jgi:hypothetical protein